VTAVDIQDNLEFAMRVARREVGKQSDLVAVDAEDLASIAIEKLHEASQRSVIDNPRGFVTRVIQRRATDLNESNARRRQREELDDRVVGESRLWSVAQTAGTPSARLRESEAASRQRGIAELLLELLEGRDRLLLVMRAFDGEKFGDIANELGFESAQVASNRWAKIVDQAMLSPQVLRRMPDGYAWVFIESVGLADGNVREHIDLAIEHLQGAGRSREWITSDIRAVLKIADEAVGSVRGRPGLRSRMAQRLVAGAAHYVHRADDVRHDFDDPNGLDDDWLVVRSVCRALELDLPSPGFTPPIRISYFLP